MRASNILNLSTDLLLVVLSWPTPLGTTASVLPGMERQTSIPLRRSLPRAAPDGEGGFGRWALQQKRKLEIRYGRQGGYNESTTDVAESLAKRQRRKGHEQLYNLYSDTEYYGEIQIGTPPRQQSCAHAVPVFYHPRLTIPFSLPDEYFSSEPFNVVLDTGSSDLWLASAGCNAVNGCPAQIPLFKPDGSHSIQKHTNHIFNVTYGSGDADGYLATDTVSLAGYSVKDQTFAACTHVSDGLLSASVSGIMGLGFKNIASSGARPMWQTLADKEQDWEMGFAFTRYLHDPRGTQQVMPGGSMAFGKRDTSLFTGQVQWNDLTQAGYWMIALDDILVDKEPVKTGSNYVAIDTGTSLIGGPASAVKAIYDKIPGAQPSSDPYYKGYYTFPCSTSTTISFVLGGKTWSISPADFNLGHLSDATRCLGAFFSLAGDVTAPLTPPNPANVTANAQPATPEWIIGDSFLKNVYTIFSYKNPTAVGFAQLSSAFHEMSRASVGSQSPRSGSEGDGQTSDETSNAICQRSFLNQSSWSVSTALLVLFLASALYATA